jgi:hypothetical protein
LITLTQAIKDGRLNEFIAQEEKRGVGPVSRRKPRRRKLRSWLQPWSYFMHRTLAAALEEMKASA